MLYGESGPSRILAGAVKEGVTDAKAAPGRFCSSLFAGSGFLMQ